jgi:hypothetical protein
MPGQANDPTQADSIACSGLHTSSKNDVMMMMMMITLLSAIEEIPLNCKIMLSSAACIYFLSFFVVLGNKKDLAT